MNKQKQEETEQIQLLKEEPALDEGLLWLAFSRDHSQVYWKSVGIMEIRVIVRSTLEDGGQGCNVKKGR